jgi:PUA domain protein
VQKHLLSQKERKEFLSRIKALYGVDLSSENVEIGKEKKLIYYYLDGKLSFFTEDLIPTLCFLQEHRVTLPTVKVDEGAVKALARGADLFAPGVVETSGEITPGTLLLVLTKTGIPVAIMRASQEVQEALSNKKGKVSTSIHWIGDEIWKMCSKR